MRRNVILAICCFSLFIVGMDNSTVNIALPAMREEFDASTGGLQWVLTTYSLVVASLLILSGAAADRLGRRRIFQIGLALFATGSLLCSLAPSLGWLIGFRVVQGIGGSMLNPVAVSIITNVFPDARERARALGIWGAVMGLSMAVGPPLGGLLVDTLGWRSVFWINVPVGVAAIVLSALLVPESRAARPRRIDPAGQVLLLATLGTVIFAIIQGPVLGWTSTPILGCFIGGGLALTALLIHESRHPEPLVDLTFFRSIPFSGATGVAVGAFGALGGFMFLITLYLQEVRGLSPLQAGLYLVPMAAMTLLFAPLSGRIVGARGTRLPLVLAGTAMAAAVLPLTQLTAHTPDALLIGCATLFGFGFGMVNAPITTTAVSSVPPERSGVAAAFASTSRQIGYSLGVAVLGAVVVSATGAGAAGFAAASRAGWWIIAGCGLAVLALGLITTGRRARRTAGAHLDERVGARG